MFCAAGIPLTPTDLAEIYKVNDPTNLCDEEEVKPDVSCGEKVNFRHPTQRNRPLNMITDCLQMMFQSQCDEIFTSAPFFSCGNLLDMESFSNVCMKDTCATENSTLLCKTISEFSRQCVYAGGKPQKWRNETFCRKTLFQSAPVSEDCTVNSIYIGGVHRSRVSVQHGVLRMQQFMSGHVHEPLCQ